MACSLQTSTLLLAGFPLHVCDHFCAYSLKSTIIKRSIRIVSRVRACHSKSVTFPKFFAFDQFQLRFVCTVEWVEGFFAQQLFVMSVCQPSDNSCQNYDEETCECRNSDGNFFMLIEMVEDAQSIQTMRTRVPNRSTTTGDSLDIVDEECNHQGHKVQNAKAEHHGGDNVGLDQKSVESLGQFRALAIVYFRRILAQGHFHVTFMESLPE
mmetsp:Transcript_35937/g.81832  ORF Transcript_35937/g.81832 Transcript_35937/m.81832 type:complete len:210 (-) Transcript_35937:94-723(-)